MKYRAILVCLATAISSIGCGENASSQKPAVGSVSQPAPAPQRPAKSIQQTGSTGLASLPPGAIDQMNPVGAPAAPVVDTAVIAPADARWTILCYAIRTQNHVEEAKELKTALIQKTRRNDWYVIHGSDSSTIYFGYYKSINQSETKDTAELERARKDHELVKSTEMLMGGVGGREVGKPFAGSAFVQLSAPDPTSRPEWNLATVDLEKDPQDATRAYWSLQIAAFRDNPLRKEAAVQVVEGLRQQGVKAYYYHGESISSVCVGAWPPDAVKAQKGDGTDARAFGKRQSENDALIVTSEPLPDNMIPNRINGQRVTALSTRLEVVDKDMFAMIRKFPYHEVNYEARARTDKISGAKIIDPSFLVVIPRAKGNGRYENDEVGSLPGIAATPRSTDTPAAGVRRTGSTGLPAVNNQPAQRQPAESGAGQLRRIER